MVSDTIFPRSGNIVSDTIYNRGMEADRLNAIENSLRDLSARSAELRRYL